MQKQLFLLLIFLFLIASNVFSQNNYQNIDFDSVSVWFMGSWQWGADTVFKSYSFNDLKNTDFAIDIDDKDERKIIISYMVADVGNVYVIESLQAVGGGPNAIFNVYRNGQLCDTTAQSVPRLSTKIIDFTTNCGLMFGAEWESITSVIAETDLEIREVELTQAEKDSVRNAFMKKSNALALDTLAGEIKSIQSNIRVIDILTDFTAFNKGVLKVYSKEAKGFDEGDFSFKNRMLVITENKTIKLVFLISSEVFEDIRGFKPTQQSLVTDFKTSQELYTALNDSRKFVQVQRKNLEGDFISEWLQLPSSVTEGISVVVGTGSATAISIATVVAAAGGTTAVYNTLLGSATGIPGAAVASVATVGGIAITGAGIIIGGSIWYFSETDIWAFDNVAINFDEEFLGGNEQKINFILYKDNSEGSSIQPVNVNKGKVKISLTTFVQAIKKKFASIDKPEYQALVANPLEGIGNGLKVYEADTSGKVLGGPLPVIISMQEPDTIVVSDLKEEKIYSFILKFESPFPAAHPPITATFKVKKVE